MKLSRACIALSSLALLLLLLSGPLTRFGMVHFRTGLLIFAAALVMAIGAFTVGTVSLLVPRLRGQSAGAFRLAVGVGLIVMAGPAVFVQKARGVPAIHDITTDTENPPLFVDVIPIRKSASAANPAEYPGASVAAEQKRAYPAITPLDLTLPPVAAFAKALEAAHAMGWEIVSENPTEGRIEATATTLWFGFKDDIVIRIVPEGSGARLDMRSASRIAGSDMGANAERIAAFIAAVK